MYFKFLDK